GAKLQVRINALDPDNPSYLPPDRASDGTLIENDVFLPTVHYQISGLPAGAVFDPDTQMLTWAPDFTSLGQHDFTVTATDDGDGLGQPQSTTQTVHIVVLNTNRAPQLPLLQNQTVDHDTTLSIPLGATDPDGDPVKLSITGLPAFGQFVDNHDGTGQLVFSPKPDDRGNYTISLAVSDNAHGD